MSAPVVLAAASVVTIPLPVRIRRFRGALLLARGDESIELDEVAAQFYKRFDGLRTLRQVADEVADLYDVATDDVLSDVVELAGRLHGWQLLEVVPGREQAVS